MKHYFFFLLFMAFGGFISTFSQGYKESFQTDICNCFSNKIKEVSNSKTAYELCYKTTLPNHASSIDASIDEENVQLKYRKGQDLRQELKQKFLYELVNSCDSYYNTLKEERHRNLMLGKSRASRSDLQRLNQQVAMTPNSNAYYRRAETYFYLGDLKLAEADVRESLKLDQARYNSAYLRKGHLLLGWILEEQKRYSEAIGIYNNTYNHSYYNDVKILIAMAKRAGGKSSSSPQEKQELPEQPESIPVSAENNKTQNTKPNEQNTQKPKKDLRKLFKL